MRHPLRAAALAVVAGALSLAGPAPANALVYEDCGDDALGGFPLQQGNPTTTPPSQYKVTTSGFEATVGPIAGVGTFHVEVNQAEASILITDPLGLTAADTGVGLDTSGAGEGDWETGVCLVVAGVGHNFYIDFDDQDTSRIGATVRVRRCTPGGSPCTTVLGHTGAEINANVPLDSCIWVNGHEQNPFVGDCPTPDPGSGPPIP